MLDRFQVNTHRENWKIFTQYIETWSDSMKVDNFITLLSTRVESGLEIWPSYLWSNANTTKKNHHLQKYLSCHSTLGRYIYRTSRIEPNLHISSSVQGILQILQVVPSSSSSSLLSSINDPAKLLHCRDDLATAPPEVPLYWQSYLIVSPFLFLFPPAF